MITSQRASARVEEQLGRRGFEFYRNGMYVGHRPITYYVIFVFVETIDVLTPHSLYFFKTFIELS